SPIPEHCSRITIHFRVGSYSPLNGIVRLSPFLTPGTRTCILLRRFIMYKRRLSIFKLALFSLLVITLSLSVMAQGKGRGGGGGGGRGSGSGNAGGPPPGVGVERGIGNSSVHSEGRSDKGRENASVKSGGRSDAGLERARMASSRLRDADRELRDHPNMARNLKLNANDLRAGYQT